MVNKFSYKWTLKDTKFKKDKGKVFSCFAGGGGSTMGYKLAGFDVLGCNEIDKKMVEVYVKNHNPKYCFLEPIQKFKKRKDLPEELYNLDILDGSPPCSSFSMSGNREKDWGKKKKFREGQAYQILDDLFFHFIDLAKKLQPKIVVAENVKGLLMGKAKKYVKRIYDKFDKAGYYCQHWLLNAAKMGVPQKRERVFFISMRKDLANNFLVQKDLFSVAPKLILEFNEPEIPFKEIYHNYTDRPLTEHMKKIWDLRKNGDKSFEIINEREYGKKFLNFNNKFIYDTGTINTIMARDLCVLFNEPRYRNFDELCECGSFPKDYDFMKNKTEYIIGMSVPPVMMARIATEIYKQWLSKM